VTTRDPFAETAAPSSVTVVAFDVAHDSVDDPPLVTLVGIAVSSAVGIGTLTVTVACAVTDPVELVATSLYVVVTVGDTGWDPLTATGDPFNVTEVALDVVHESVDAWPL
jgi:hypothetical protein